MEGNNQLRYPKLEAGGKENEENDAITEMNRGQIVKVLFLRSSSFSFMQ